MPKLKGAPTTDMDKISGGGGGGAAPQKGARVPSVKKKGRYQGCFCNVRDAFRGSK